MTRRLAVAGLLAAAPRPQRLLGSGLTAQGGARLRPHVSRLEYELLLDNGRLRHGLPVHFTVTSSIAATFDYQTNAAILGAGQQHRAERGRQRRGDPT